MKNLFKALAKFQQLVPILHKDASGYGYTYTPLATIVEKITPILKECNLGYYQAIEKNSIKTVVFEITSGESIESLTKMPIKDINYIIRLDKNKKEKDVIQGFAGMNQAQAYGSLITYFRRYSLSAILGLVTDKDADARNKRKEKENKPKPKLTKDKFNDVIKAIANGYTIEQIRVKYSITDKLFNDLKAKANETV